jgi:cytoskeletal protein CcmA (bactofilin family)
MFNRDQKEFNTKEAETIIGPSVKVKGNFHGQGNIIIEGQVEGSVKTDKYLLVGEKAKITASVEAGEAKIAGNITGNIIIKGYLEITATAEINGDINAQEISIEKGGVVNGRLTSGSVEKSKRQIEETK